MLISWAFKATYTQGRTIASHYIGPLRLVSHASITLAPCRPVAGLPSQSEEVSVYLD